ncbi:HIT family protein [Patescibacteria group bacterium]|nr:HIT family protein [Patescibacteria group bacterium]
MLDRKESEAIKKELISHIEKNFPEDKKDFAKSQILSMEDKRLEEFLEENGIRLNTEKKDDREDSSCIFCLIASNKIRSYPLKEDENAIAVLEINPLSKGHTIIIPKKHIPLSEKIPSSVSSFIKELTERIKDNLNPERIEVMLSNIEGHGIINLIPVYGKEINKERKKADIKELEEVKELLSSSQKEKVIKKSKKKKVTLINTNKEKSIWLPKRIP